MHDSVTAMTPSDRGGNPPLADVAEAWPVVGSEDILRNDWVMALRRDHVTHPEGGEPFDRLVFEHPGAVVILAVDADERVLCLRQYRHAVGRRFVELPAGLLDAHGEEPLEVAKRELREEAQYAAAEWRHLVSAFTSPGASTELIHYFLARDLTPADRGDFVLEHEEAEMEVFWAAADELLDASLAGDLTDGPLLMALLAYDALRRRGRL